MDYLSSYFSSFWHLLLEMSPWLLLGFFFAGILHVYVPAKSLEKHMGKNSFGSILKALLIGIPLPLCSCGVIPTAISFYRNGASKASTNAFLISTPQTGIDSIFATYALMGWPIALIRPFMAFLTGFLGGWITKIFLPSSKESMVFDETETCESSCCATEAPRKRGKLQEALHYGFIVMMKDIVKWLLIGLALAALISVVVPDTFFEHYIGNFWLELLVVLAFSIPLYVCATGSIPIATALLLKGMSPAAALLFLMAGPATNLVTVTVIGKAMGKKSLYAYLVSIIGGALLFSIVIHYTLPSGFLLKTLPIAKEGAHGLFPRTVNSIAACLLLFFMVYALFSRYLPSFETSTQQKKNMQTLKVKGLSCSHCVARVNEALEAKEEVTSVALDLETGKLEVEGTLSIPQIKEIVEALGYTLID